MAREITVTYYGMIAEKLGKSTEILNFPEEAVALKPFFQNLYPALDNFTYTIAVDLEFSDTLQPDQFPTKIDVMPPFAGG